MARRGRPAKAGVQRYENGGIKKPSVAEQAEAKRQTEIATKLVVLRQPHRNGDESPMLECPLGQFVKRHRLRIEYFHAGERYGSIASKILAAKQAPTDIRIAGTGLGVGPTDKLVRQWEAEEQALDKALRRASPLAREAIRDLAVHRREVGADMVAVTINALTALAVQLGMTRKGLHPFL